MRIDQPDKKKLTQYISILFGLTSVVLVLMFVGIFIFGSHRRLQNIKFRLIDQPIAKISTIAKKLTGPSSKTDIIPSLELNIKFKHAKKLADQRNEAVRTGILLKRNKDFVPGEVIYNSKKYSAKVRLKGDWTDHFNTNKWSFRVNLKGGKKLMGMRVFSLHRPEARNNLYEWLFAKLLENESILTPRYYFIHLTFNGKYKGIYALEEGFRKELIESQRKRESILVKYDETTMWEERAHFNHTDPGNFKKPSFSSYFQIEPYEFYTPLDVYDVKNVNLDNNFKKRADSALGLVKKAMDKDGKASTIFDVTLMGKFLAITEFLNARHSLYWHNLRFYFNPVTYKLEPIGFDSDSGHQNNYLNTFILNRDKEAYGLKRYVLSDLEIFKSFYNMCQKIASADYFSKMLEMIKSDYETYQRVLKVDGINATIDFNWLKQKQKFIEKSLNPPAHTLSYAYIKNKKVVVKIKNLTNIPIEIDSINFGSTIIGSKKLKKYFSNPFYKDYATPVIPAKNIGKNQTATFIFPQEFMGTFEQANFKASVTSRIFGSQILKTHACKNFDTPKFVKGIPTPLTHSQVLSKFPRGKIKKEGNTYTILSGKYTLRNYLTLPYNHNLIISPGVTISFAQNAGIIVNGSFKSQGTNTRPITLKPINKFFRGLLVYNAKDHSVIEHTIIDAAIASDVNGWQLTGGTTFYQSDLLLKNSILKNSRTEDMLNIIRAKLLIKNSVFKNCLSDAIDVDFGEGLLQSTHFEDIGGDGFDASGSKISLNKVSAHSVTDKAVSAGENSTINIADLFVKDSGIGVASKDLSSVNLHNATIVDTKTAFAAYQKKAEFGPAILNGDNITMNGIDNKFLLQTNSQMKINNQTIKSQEINIEELYNKQ